MKDSKDKLTPDLLTAKRPVGRPPSPNALTPAEKQKAYRDRRRAEKQAAEAEKLAAEAEKAAKEVRSDVIDLSAITPPWRR